MKTPIIICVRPMTLKQRLIIVKLIVDDGSGSVLKVSDKVSLSRRNYKLRSEQVRAATLWSALTCQRFGRSRPVAATVALSQSKLRRQAASDQSGDRSPHSKELDLRKGPQSKINSENRTRGAGDSVRSRQTLSPTPRAGIIFGSLTWGFATLHPKLRRHYLGANVYQ